MKPSYYNLFIDNFPEENRCLIYNTRTQAMGVFEMFIAEMLKQRIGVPLELKEEQFPELLEEGFCVQNQVDEKYLLKEWFKELSYNKKIITATVLTTYSCNFACPYCFEQNSEKRVIHMTSSTAEIVCKWIAYKALERGASGIDLFFYGGEPLLNKKIIFFIADTLSSFAIRNHLQFRFGIVTNGYLINKKDTSILKSKGLDFYRITMDGSEEWHNRTRFLKSGGQPTFSRIISNIENNIEEGVKVLISGNITEKNYDGILQLIEYFGVNRVREKIHSMSFAPVIPVPGSKGRGEASNCFKESRHENNEKVCELNKVLEKYGFMESRSRIGMQGCPFKIFDTDITIAPDGAIFKCPITLGNKEFCVGHVACMELNSRNEEIVSAEPWKKCFPCVYLPLCQAGCYYQSYAKHGDLFAIDCPKKILEPYLLKAVKEEYAKNK